MNREGEHMENFNFDPREFREQVFHMTQSELAALLGVRQDYVSRMERNPLQIPVEIIIKLADLAGLSVDAVLGYRPISAAPLEVKQTWVGMKYYCTRLLRMIDSFRATQTDRSLFSDTILSDLQKRIEKCLEKPIIGIAGTPLSGKGTLTNTLLGRKVIPVSATSSLRIPILIKHRKDKPEHIDRRVNVLLLDRRKGDGRRLVELAMSGDDCTVASGGLELLHSFAERNDGYFDHEQVGLALVFSKGDILKNCDLLKLPSLELTTDVHTVTEGFNGALDGIFYLHPATQEVTHVDVLQLKSTLEFLAPESGPRKEGGGLFLLASKARLSGSLENAQKHLDLIGQHYYSSMPPSFWEKLSERKGIRFDRDDFCSGLYTYARDAAPYREDFERDVSSFIEQLPYKKQEQAAAKLRTFCANIQRYLDRAEYQSAPDADWQMQIEQTRDMVVDAIQRHRRTVLTQFDAHYEQLLSKQGVQGQMEDTATRVNAQQIQRISSSISQELVELLRDELDRESVSFSEKVDAYLTVCEITMGEARYPIRSRFFQFAQEVSSFGGLRYWSMRNENDAPGKLPVDSDTLHSAVEVTKNYQAGQTAATVQKTEGTSELNSNVGHALTGVVAGAAALASFTLPITALGAIAGMGVGAALAGTKSASGRTLYSNIRRTFTAQEVQEKYDQCIRQYWDDTERDFKNASKKLEEDLEDFLQKAAAEDRSCLMDEKEQEAITTFLASLPF